jgi:hypothetical protein
MLFRGARSGRRLNHLGFVHMQSTWTFGTADLLKSSLAGERAFVFPLLWELIFTLPPKERTYLCSMKRKWRGSFGMIRADQGLELRYIAFEEAIGETLAGNRMWFAMAKPCPAESAKPNGQVFSGRF